MLKVGLQLYTLREELEQDFEGTIRKVAELGYSGVEFFHYFGRTAEQVKALLEETGLVAVGAHRPYDAMLNDTEQEITFNLEIGNRNLIVPYLTEEQRNWPEVAAVCGPSARNARLPVLFCLIIIMILNSRRRLTASQPLIICSKRCLLSSFKWRWIHAGCITADMIRQNISVSMQDACRSSTSRI